MDSLNGDSENGLDDFDLTSLPPGRLKDILDSLDKKPVSVVNLDACLPTGADSVPILRVILHKITANSHVKTLSLRFNRLRGELLDIFIEWLLSNDTLETLYFQATDVDEKSRKIVEDVWKKNLSSHRSGNFGYTLTRVPL